jgi:uncharacterized membrane protein YagU involved in acid resistance
MIEKFLGIIDMLCAIFVIFAFPFPILYILLAKGITTVLLDYKNVFGYIDMLCFFIVFVPSIAWIFGLILILKGFMSVV